MSRQHAGNCIENHPRAPGSALLREDGKIRELFGDHATAEAFRQEIQSTPATPHSASVDIPLSQACKRALGRGADFARVANHRTIDCLHLLAGLLYETMNQSPAGSRNTASISTR